MNTVTRATLTTWRILRAGASAIRMFCPRWLMLLRKLSQCCLQGARTELDRGYRAALGKRKLSWRFNMYYAIILHYGRPEITGAGTNLGERRSYSERINPLPM